MSSEAFPRDIAPAKTHPLPERRAVRNLCRELNEAADKEAAAAKYRRCDPIPDHPGLVRDRPTPIGAGLETRSVGGGVRGDRPVVGVYRPGDDAMRYFVTWDPYLGCYLPHIVWLPVQEAAWPGRGTCLAGGLPGCPVGAFAPPEAIAFAAEALDRLANVASTAASVLHTAAPEEAARFQADEALAREALARIPERFRRPGGGAGAVAWTGA